MKNISDLFQTQRQRELGNFLVYVLEDGPADGNSPVRCVAITADENLLRCGFLVLSEATREYGLAVIGDVYGPLHTTEFDESGTVGGMRCVLARYDRKFLKVSGTADPSVFRIERDHVLYRGRLS